MQNFLCVTELLIVYFRIGELDEGEGDDEGDDEDDNDSTMANENPKILERKQSTVVEAGDKEFQAKKSLSGIKLYWQQFFGLIVKRFIYTKRRYLLYSILACMPVLQAMLLQFMTSNDNDGKQIYPSLTMSPDMYSESVVYYHNDLPSKVCCKKKVNNLFDHFGTKIYSNFKPFASQ